MHDTFQRVAEVIRKQIPSAGSIRMDSELVRDLGADSLDQMNMLCDLEDAFDVEIPAAEEEKIRTVRDAVELMERLQNK
jgi:acyl carrier protein